MHENASEMQCKCMAGGSIRHGQPAAGGLVQRPDAGLLMVACGAQHGAGVENPAQSAASQGQRPGNGQADVEGVRSPGGGHPRYEGEPCEEERLALVGRLPRDRRRSLHPQAGPQLVEAATPGGPVSTDNVLRLLERQRYRCALTGRRLTPQTAALDHIVPIRRGGEHAIENTQVLHKDVNRAKGALTSEEFLAVCREVIRWSDSVTERNGHEG